MQTAPDRSRTVSLERLGHLLAITRRLKEHPADAAAWSLSATTGRIVELSGNAALTMAFGLVLDAQRRGDPAAWVTGRESSFYPPDAAAYGVDLAALPVVRVPAEDVARAADPLVRSGTFGLLVLDVGEARVPTPLLGRLLGLAQKHETAFLILCARPLGSLTSLRAEATLSREGQGQFRCTLTAVKDKRRAQGWTHLEICRGPPGLR